MELHFKCSRTLVKKSGRAISCFQHSPFVPISYIFYTKEKGCWWLKALRECKVLRQYLHLLEHLLEGTCIGEINKKHDCLGEGLFVCCHLVFPHRLQDKLHVLMHSLQKLGNNI